MRTYTETERAEAVAMAAAVGPVKAAAQLGIPRRTVASWMHKPAHSAVIAAAEEDIAASLRALHAEALTEVRAGLHNPKARLGDKVAALRVLGEQLALAEGRATSNVAINSTTNAGIDFGRMDDRERRELADFLDQVAETPDAELVARFVEQIESAGGTIDVG